MAKVEFRFFTKTDWYGYGGAMGKPVIAELDVAHWLPEGEEMHIVCTVMADPQGVCINVDGCSPNGDAVEETWVDQEHAKEGQDIGDDEEASPRQKARALEAILYAKEAQSLSEFAALMKQNNYEVM